MQRKTLYNVKKECEVPTNGIYIKNTEEKNKSSNPNIAFHKDAEKKSYAHFKRFKNGEIYGISNSN